MRLCYVSLEIDARTILSGSETRAPFIAPFPTSRPAPGGSSRTGSCRHLRGIMQYDPNQDNDGIDGIFYSPPTDLIMTLVRVRHRQRGENRVQKSIPPVDYLRLLSISSESVFSIHKHFDTAVLCNAIQLFPRSLWPPNCGLPWCLRSSLSIHPPKRIWPATVVM